MMKSLEGLKNFGGELKKIKLYHNEIYFGYPVHY